MSKRYWLQGERDRVCFSGMLYVLCHSKAEGRGHTTILQLHRPPRKLTKLLSVTAEVGRSTCVRLHWTTQKHFSVGLAASHVAWREAPSKRYPVPRLVRLCSGRQPSQLIREYSYLPQKGDPRSMSNLQVQWGQGAHSSWATWPPQDFVRG